MLRHIYALMMLEAGESVVTVARWLGHTSPAVTLGYHAHFMAEAGSKGRTAMDGLLQREGDPPCRWTLPRFSPGLLAADFPDCAGPDLIVNSKAAESDSLGKC